MGMCIPETEQLENFYYAKHMISGFCLECYNIYTQ